MIRQDSGSMQLKTYAIFESALQGHICWIIDDIILFLSFVIQVIRPTDSGNDIIEMFAKNGVVNSFLHRLILPMPF